MTRGLEGPAAPLAPGFVIVDRTKRGPVERRAYLSLSFPTERAARAALEDLLRHYPVGHLWRLRLTVEEHSEARK